MSSVNKVPVVGVGVLIFNEGKLLLGKRKSKHGKDTWSPPGGHLEFGETFEACAIREVKEEVGLDIQQPAYLYTTNNIFADEGKHTISVFMKAKYPEGQSIINNEIEKAADWNWFSLDALPENLFLPLQLLMAAKLSLNTGC